MPENTTTDSTKTDNDALNIAVTKLILDLKGDGTVSLLETLTGVQRKTLSLALRTCQDMEEKKMSWDEYSEMKQKEEAPEFPPTKISWGLTSIDKVSKAMGIRVSDFIRAAEDVQDGLPPWFQNRIRWKTSPQTQNEFTHIFLEAVGCRTYISSDERDPLHIAGKRKSRRGSSEWGFSDIEVSSFSFLADYLFGHPQLEEFVKAYRTGKISSKDAYHVLKEAIDYVYKVCKQVPPPPYRRWKKGGKDNRNRLAEMHELLCRNKSHLIDCIIEKSRPFLQEAKN